jgi:hypothetical protein
VLGPLSQREKSLVTEEDRWQEDMEILRHAARELAAIRSTSSEVSQSSVYTPTVEEVPQSDERQSTADQNVLIRALYDLDPERAASLFNLAVRDGSPEGRRTIGSALVTSGLVDEAIDKLFDRQHQNSYGELSLLFLAAKAGEVRPLIKLIEKHPSTDLRLAILHLLASSGGSAVLPAFQRLAVKGSLPISVRSAIQVAIAELSTHQKETASSAA